MRRIAAALALGALAWEALHRWRPRPMSVSPETLDDIARRHDTAGLSEWNEKDARPFAVTSMRILKQDRPGVDPRFRRAK